MAKRKKSVSQENRKPNNPSSTERKPDDANTNSTKKLSAPVEVVVEDVSSHPICLHGPTLLFSTEKGNYFACSASRDKKDCTLHIDEEDWLKESVKERNMKYLELMPKLDKKSLWKNCAEVKSNHATTRGYCITCNILYTVTKDKEHSSHRVINPVTDEQLKQPWTTLLPPLANDKVEAQYMFTKKSIAVVLNVLKKNNVKNILCIGTPSIHEAASAHKFDSLLLDYDSRLARFMQPDKFLWYNMFNNYLFGGRDDEKILKKFFLKSKGSGLAIVMDPPFGGRVEPLVHTIRELSDSYNSVCGGTGLLPVVWAFPYFSEPYIVNSVPEIKMLDFQVEYENHSKFQNKNDQGRKHGSPVRFFTNLPLNTFDLSTYKNYKFCDKCRYYVSESNKHCQKCNECTSKNGMTYKHCDVCKRCVKPTFFHCGTCKRCCQLKNHVCGVEVISQSCFNCNGKGHKRSLCPDLAPAKKLKTK